MKFKVISFDLEIIPLNINQMPSPEICPIILASCHFNYDYIIENTKTRNIVLILTKDDEKVEIRTDNIVFYFKDETKLILKLFELLKSNDIITGFNINNFDLVYLYERCKVLKIKNTNIGNGDSRLYCSKHLSKGFLVTSVVGLTGKIVIDVLAILKREDATNVFLKKYNLKKLTLEHVSKEILKIEKLEFPLEDMIIYWKDTNDIELRNKFIEYCSRDSQLALEFLTKFRLLDKFIALAKVSGKLVQDIINSQGSGLMVENLLLQEFRKDDRVMPIRMRSERDYDDDEDLLKGAYVMVNKFGVTENLCVLDYSALYPSLIIKHNICYTTLITEKDLSKLGLTENDVEVQKDEYGMEYATFVKKEKLIGIMPRILKRLLDSRAILKKEMKKYEKGTSEYLLYDSSQNAVKIVANSAYGYSGDSTSKVYSWYIATTVTTNGRLQIKKTIDMINALNVQKNDIKYSLRVIMTDTDSTYVNVIRIPNENSFLSVITNLNSKNDEYIYRVSKEDCIWAVNYAANEVNKTLEKPMNLAYESYIRRIVIAAKKHYGMLIIDDNGKESITTKGLETVRRDWCNFSTNTMSEIIDFILKEKDIAIGVNKSIELIRQRARLLKKDKIDMNDLVLSKKLTKLVTLYDNKAIHAQVAIKMKERGKPSEVGDRIQYYILSNGHKLISDKAEEADYVMKNLDKCKIDKDYYITKQLIPPTLRILETLGVKEETLLTGIDENQKSLFDY